MNFIPVNEPVLGEAEREAVRRCLESGWISSEGPAVREFEARMAEYTGRRHAVAVSSGSAALDVAVAALGIEPGDEVVIPDFCIISCALAVVRAGATPVVVDADPLTCNMDVAQLESACSSRTRAIMAVHTYGLPVDMDPVRACAARLGVPVIEDAAEALGWTYRGTRCGALGDISSFSFYANKLVTTGEGGMVVTDRDDWAERVRGLRNLCFQAERRFVHAEMGWNYRMSSVTAALGVAQMDQLEAHHAAKVRIGRMYQERLNGVRGLICPLPKTDYTENGYWVFGVVLEDELPLDAPAVMARLHQAGIGTRPFFWPMHEQPVWCKQGLFDGVTCPVSARLARRGFYLPGSLNLNEGQIDRIAEAVKQAISYGDHV